MRLMKAVGERANKGTLKSCEIWVSTMTESETKGRMMEMHKKSVGQAN